MLFRSDTLRNQKAVRILLRFFSYEVDKGAQVCWVRRSPFLRLSRRQHPILSLLLSFLLLEVTKQFFCVVSLIKKETRILWVRVNHSVDRLAQHFWCPALAHCPPSFLNLVKILAKCMKASLVRSKKPAVASTMTSSLRMLQTTKRRRRQDLI